MSKVNQLSMCVSAHSGKQRGAISKRKKSKIYWLCKDRFGYKIYEEKPRWFIQWFGSYDGYKVKGGIAAWKSFIFGQLHPDLKMRAGRKALVQVQIINGKLVKL